MESNYWIELDVYEIPFYCFQLVIIANVFLIDWISGKRFLYFFPALNKFAFFFWQKHYGNIEGSNEVQHFKMFKAERGRQGKEYIYLKCVCEFGVSSTFLLWGYRL